MAANFFAQGHYFSGEGYCRNDHIVANRCRSRFGAGQRLLSMTSNFCEREGLQFEVFVDAAE